MAPKHDSLFVKVRLGALLTTLVLCLLSFQVGAQSYGSLKLNSENETCVCVYFHLCFDNGTYDATAMNAVGPRSSWVTAKVVEPKCEIAGQICCRIFLDPNDTMTPSPSSPALRDPFAPQLDSDAPSPSASQQPPAAEVEPLVAHPVAIPKRGCGIQRVPFATRIIAENGNHSLSPFASYAQFPWMLIVLVKNESSDSHLFTCGASLIHKQIALTAAHCVNGKDMSNLMIRGGEWDTSSPDEPQPHQDRSVQRIIFHPEYQTEISHAGNSLQNDIAIMVLDSPFTLAENIDTICLPTQDEKFDGSRCITTGWGKDSLGRYQRYLRKVELPVLTQQECETKLRRTRVGPFFKLHDSFLCAGGEPGQDTCEGDGGGPLVCPMQGTDQWKQAGIVSWGVECGSSAPGVYVNLAKYTQWILEELTSVSKNSDNQAKNLSLWFGPRGFDQSSEPQEPNGTCAITPAIGFFVTLFISVVFPRLKQH